MKKSEVILNSLFIEISGINYFAMRIGFDTYPIKNPKGG